MAGRVNSTVASGVATTMPIAMAPGAPNIKRPSTCVQILGVNITSPHGAYRNYSVKLVVDQQTRKKRDFESDIAEIQWSLDTAYAFGSGPPLRIELGERSPLGRINPITSWNLPFLDAHKAVCLCPNEAIEYALNGQTKLVLTISSSDNDSIALRANTELLRRQKAVIDRLGKWESTAATSIEFATALSEVHPIAKAVLASVNVVYKILKDKQQCNQLILELVEDMARMLDCLEEIKRFTELKILEEAMNDAVTLVDETKRFITTNYSQDEPNSTIRFALGPSTLGQIQDIRARFGRIKEYIDRAVAIQTAEMLSSEKILSDLKPKDVGEFEWPAECMDGTRKDILDMIEAWTKDFKAPNILWIKGHPGVGKSAIASSVMTCLRKANRLGSRFLFKRARDEVLTPSALWRTASLDLFRKYPTVKKHLMAKRGDDGHFPIPDMPDDLFRQLILEPLMDDGGIPEERAPVIVIDALDECGGLDGQHSQHRKTILSNLSLWSSLPCRFKIIVTSRGESTIEAALKKISQTIEIPVTGQSSMDIKLFFTSSFRDIPDRTVYRSIPSDWPGTEVIEELTGGASGLFMWAKVVVTSIAKLEPLSTLKQIRGGNDGAVGMEGLYSTILEISFPRRTREEIKAFDSILETIHSLFGSIILVHRPLSARSIANLLQVEKTSIEHICNELSSVMGWSGDVPQITHQSFTDFLLNKETCPSAFYISRQAEERKLALACLRVMESGLQFNICRLDTSYLLNSEVLDMNSRIDKYIPAHLQYACWYWADHLLAIECDDDEVLAHVQRFIDVQFLFWLEVLSVTKRMNTASHMVSSLGDYLRRYRKDDPMVVDMQKFITVFAGVISQSAPHIYVSALPFAPQSSAISSQYVPQYSGSLKVEKGGLKDWPVIQNVFHGHANEVNSVAFSPDGSRVVSGSDDMMIRIWDVETGEAVTGPLGGHVDVVRSVAFSPDGEYVASGSNDKTINIWNAETGEVVAGPFEGHTGRVESISFSPNGSRIVSGSWDQTIRIWDSKIGKVVAGPLEGHTDLVQSVAFSPDGRRIVSGSRDKTIRIWDAETGEEVALPFEGHTNSVKSVAFSPDGRRVASGSWDKTIRIWDAETGQTVVGPFGHGDEVVESLAFSPDGGRVVSGSDNATIRIWDAATGEVVAGPFEGHTHSVQSVAFSPDGRRVASGSWDKTIIIWDAASGEAIAGQFEGHTHWVQTVAFSPNGGLIASGSSDETIRIWNAETGEGVKIPFEGDAGVVESLAFSQDGKQIASASIENTIRIWDVETGEGVQAPFEENADTVGYLAFSPDGRQIASASVDNTIMIWNAETGSAVAGPFEGHKDWVQSAAFSPDGTRVASGSWDKTVRIWDVVRGERVAGPFEGHTDGVKSLAFSPDGKRVASGSDDSTIIIWDAETGERISGPLEGHADVVESLAFSPNGRRVASGSRDNTIRIWDADIGEGAVGTFEGHTSSVQSVAFSPDGSRIVSGSYDKTVRIWDVEYDPNRPLWFVDTSRMQEGWILDSHGNHLFWVPPSLRPGLLRSNTRAIIGNLMVSKLELDAFKHGEEWTKCRASALGTS